ncbi:uncharacterized protein [Pempheris klunzingeri]
MLRDQHRRERQREKERRESGVGLFNYRPWRYSAILSFLNPFIDARAAGTNGWALDRQLPLVQVSEMGGCSTTTEMRSDDDDNYGIAVADATTTSSSSSSEFVHRKRPSSANRDGVRLKEAKTEVTSEAAATDDGVQTQQVQHDNMRELFEVMMQSVTALASSLASSHSSSQSSDQLMPPAQSSPVVLQPDLQHHHQTHRGLQPSRPHHLKTEEQDVVAVELSDQTDEEEEEGRRATSPRPTRARRKSMESLLEEYLRRMEAREVQRDCDGDQRDDVTLFLLSLAPAMRRLPAEKQSWVRTKMQQFLHETEFGSASFQ